MNSTTAIKSIIGEDTEITGTVRCASHIQLDGKLDGDLSCTGNAVIGSTARVKGNVSAESVCILGEVNGNVTVRDRIELKSTARLNGDIKAKRLTVEDGVTFVGKSEVNPAGPAGARPAPGPQAPAAPVPPPETEEGDGRARQGFFARKG